MGQPQWTTDETGLGGFSIILQIQAINPPLRPFFSRRLKNSYRRRNDINDGLPWVIALISFRALEDFGFLAVLPVVVARTEPANIERFIVVIVVSVDTQCGPAHFTRLTLQVANLDRVVGATSGLPWCHGRGCRDGCARFFDSSSAGVGCIKASIAARSSSI